jgi:hypothetical protein
LNCEINRRIQMQISYPEDPKAWRELIQREVSLDVSYGIKAYEIGTFPHEVLGNWIVERFSEGYHPSFVPALLRNIKGLVMWVYGNGEEPLWTGSDEESLNQRG